MVVTLMTEERYRTHELCQFNYSEIWKKSIYENCTDTPLRNDEIVSLLNEQDVEIQRLLSLLNKQDVEIHRLKTIIDGLNYALKNIKKIDVEIDLNKCGDVE